jgi:hypothetical protein
MLKALQADHSNLYFRSPSVLFRRYMTKPSRQNGRSHANLTSLNDELGRSLPCYIEHTFELDDTTYGLLFPVHIPVDIVAWQPVDDDDGEEPVLATEEEIDAIFEIASDVLAKHDLLLQRTALVLTVVGDIPDLDNIDDLEDPDDDEDEDDEVEELIFLDSFVEGDREYSICVPLDPMLIVVRFNEDSQPELLSAEEFQQLEPMLPSLESSLAEHLFDDLD